KWHRAPVGGAAASSSRRSETLNGTERRIGVLGAGSFGTALAAHLAGTGGHRVKLWARDPELAARMTAERANTEYLAGVELPRRLETTTEMAALVDSELLLVVVPSTGFRAVLRTFLRLT